ILISSQVLRWSSLGLGIFYGIYHQASISSRDRIAKEKADYQHKESLISQAKSEWAKQNAPAQSTPSSGANADPKDPNADLLAVYGISDEK
ncbi:hypothetical protein EJ04DRAFT_439458, partial [Polyplosphaeria fusca]